ncbi:DNA primase [Candidatus Uhrbacteria bacterium]|nr:DNA primase [Candidatus Uhrbacteria bacterium]
MDPIEEIKSKIDIVDIVGEYLTLQMAGGNFRARCPFHDEKTPSFMVSRAKQIWHCFGGCNEGGDIFKFVMKQEGMEFGEALRYLAGKAGVLLERQDPRISGQKHRLLDLLERAADYYHQALRRAPASHDARAYVAARILDPGMIDSFLLGFSLPEQSALSTYLLSKKFTAHEIMQAGLAIQKEQGYGLIDRFRGRIMIPIRNLRGDVVGFGGRILKDDQTLAKYINSPQTPLYDKSRIVFGLDFAKQDIRKNDAAIIVEGYMDFFSVYGMGMKNVVASSGTALTTDHIRLLSRFTQNLLFSFDMDAAGTKATMRGIEQALAEGMNVKIIRLPRNSDGSLKYKDPDECIRADVSAWEQSVRDASSFMEYHFDTLLTPAALSDGFEKRTYARQLLQSIGLLSDRIEQDHWIRNLGTRIGISESLLWEELSAMKRGVPLKQSAQAEKKMPTEKKYDSREELLLALLLKNPRIIFSLSSLLTGTMIQASELREMYESLCTLGREFLETPDMIGEAAEKRCSGEVPDMLRLLADKEWGDVSDPELDRIALALAAALRDAHLRLEITRLQARMRDAEQRKDRAAMEDYAKQFRDLQNM